MKPKEVGHLVTYTVQADIPGWDGPFVLEVPSMLGDEDAARRRAMWVLIAQGKFEPEGTPEQELKRFKVVETLHTGI